MPSIPFLKMHGAGNDFVIFDARKTTLPFTDRDILHITDRHKGIGCDQLITLLPSQRADCFMRIHNQDASISATCGNATRCVAKIIMGETGKNAVTIETLAGILPVGRAAGGLVTVDMGKPRTGWQDIPLAEPRDTLHLGIVAGNLQDPVGVSMGNPHAVFFVDNATVIDLATLGPQLEHHPLFPERANISVAQVTSPASITLRVWERGAGETLACGSGACATMVAAQKRGLVGNQADIRLKGGLLSITLREDGNVLMTGEAVESFRGLWKS